MKTVIFVILAIIGYSSIAGAWIAGLKIAAEKYVPEFDPYLDLWPGLCGAFWPVGGPAAAIYILVMAYIEENN
nr:MAG TPA: hypothetical protein [Caudoviricetes sp.]